MNGPVLLADCNTVPPHCPVDPATWLTSAAIADLLRHNGIAVSIVDHDPAHADWTPRIAAQRPAVLAVHSVCTDATAPALFAQLEQYHREMPQVPVSVYGDFPTRTHERLRQRYPWLHATICGAPEDSFDQALAGTGLAVIPPANGRVPVVTQVCPDGTGGVLLASRGQVSPQPRCSLPSVYAAAPAWQGCSAADTIAALARLAPALATPHVTFVDADFFGPPTDTQCLRVRQIATELQRLGLSFALTCRPAHLSPDMVQRLVDAGLTRVSLTAGSLHPAQQHATVQAITALRACGIEPELSCVMFPPDSTIADIRSRFTFLSQTGLLASPLPAADLLAQRELVLRGTPAFTRLQQAARLQPAGDLCYSGSYRFADPAVQAVADGIVPIGDAVRQFSSHPRSAIHPANGNRRVADNVTRYLQECFERLLSRAEQHPLPADPAAGAAEAQECIWHIEGLLVEARVCQA